MINFYNVDCVEFMKGVADNHYDFAIVDPPYGIGADIKNNQAKKQCKKSVSKSNFYGEQKWDANTPSQEYFSELKRVSKKQLIWGANYFGLVGGYLYWDKHVTMPTYSTGELAWLSWLNKVDYVSVKWHGAFQENMSNKEKRIHPTQKPVQLYRWILQKYAKKGDLILDTHGGGMSIAIACTLEGFTLDICEIDETFFKNGRKRYNDFKQQPLIFLK